MTTELEVNVGLDDELFESLASQMSDEADRWQKANTLLANALQLAQRGEHESALDLCNEVICLFPDWAEAYGSRAHCFVRLGQVPRAIEDFTRALELKPGNVASTIESFFHRGRAEALYGRDLVRRLAGA